MRLNSKIRIMEPFPNFAEPVPPLNCKQTMVANGLEIIEDLECGVHAVLWQR